MRIIDLNETSRKNLLEELIKRSPGQYGEYALQVEAILKEVKEQGDEALLSYTERFDKVRLSKEDLLVTPEEIREAYNQVDPHLLEVMRKALHNIRSYHEKQRRFSWFDSQPNGTLLGQKITALQSVEIGRAHV